VAVALRLGYSVCVPHTCRCGALVDVQGTHGLVCKQAPGKIARHQAVNQGCYRYCPIVSPIFDIDTGLKSIVDTDIDTLP